MKIFLVGGKSGSGKTEVAKIIKDYYAGINKKAIITEYSKYLKLYAKEITGWNGSDEKPRKFLQDLGITIKENLGINNMLINRMLEDIKVYALYADVLIISDVRYPEEIEEIKKVFGDDAKSIYVINQFAKSTLTLEEQMHITEIALENYSNFDLTITNDNINVVDNKITEFLERVDN